MAFCWKVSWRILFCRKIEIRRTTPSKKETSYEVNVVVKRVTELWRYDDSLSIVFKKVRLSLLIFFTLIVSIYLYMTLLPSKYKLLYIKKHRHKNYLLLVLQLVCVCPAGQIASFRLKLFVHVLQLFPLLLYWQFIREFSVLWSLAMSECVVCSTRNTTL